MKKIYFNGDIITMSRDKKANCVVTEDNKIVFVGDLNKSNITLSNDDKYIDLEGKAILPAFFSSHGYFIAQVFSLLECNAHGCDTDKELLTKIESFIQNSVTDYVLVRNCKDDFLFSDTLNQLDHSIMIECLSHQRGYLNHKAKDQLKVKSEKNVFENEEWEKIKKKFPKPTTEELLSATKKISQDYLAQGITTVMDGYLIEPLFQTYQFLYDNNHFTLDTVGFTDTDCYETYGDYFSDEYRKHFRLGGMKIILDGQPENMQAYMKDPYLHTRHFGQLNIPLSDFRQLVKDSSENNVQLLLQCNGDQTLEEVIESLRIFDKTKIQNQRYVLVQSKLIGVDQLHKIKRFGLLPSYNPTNYLQHIETYHTLLGKERTSLMLPMKSTSSRKISFSLHNDEVNGVPNSVQLLYDATNRIKFNKVIGKKERLSIKNAIKGMTINAAYQLHEEDKKGSIEIGKLANFVIFNKNPLDLKRQDLLSLSIEQTIMNGNIVYTKNQKDEN